MAPSGGNRSHPIDEIPTWQKMFALYILRTLSCLSLKCANKPNKFREVREATMFSDMVQSTLGSMLWCREGTVMPNGTTACRMSVMTFQLIKNSTVFNNMWCEFIGDVHKVYLHLEYRTSYSIRFRTGSQCRAYVCACNAGLCGYICEVHMLPLLHDSATFVLDQLSS